VDSHRGPYQTIDEYIATFPADIQAILQAVRATIREAAPDAKERISYQIPTFTLHGNLVHFAAFKHHIGFYPTSSGTAAFHDELAPYVVSKGTVRFPLDQPLPMELIARVVRFRVAENLSRAAAKAHRPNA
jgi:uncharacterized protein YdhG (YjbR/CyaY superfamily)